MNSWMDAAAFALGGGMLAIMAFGIVFTAVMPALDRWNKRYFITLFSLLFTSVAALFIDNIIYRFPNVREAEQFLVFVEFLTVSVLMPTPSILLLHWCGERIKSSLLFRAEAALWGAFFLVLAAAQFTDVFYVVTPSNQFVRGPLFALLPVLMLLMMILNIEGVIRSRKKLSKRYFVAILVYLVPMTAALFDYTFNYLALFLIFGMVLCAMVMFSIIITDYMEQYMRQQRKLADQRASVMVLQMRPHFICNTMMGIYYLCDRDPQKAKQVTLDFTAYLRKNFTAIASEDTVPFAGELEHTRAYLAVEQAQFEDSLFVSFDTPHTMFRLPPLTLQPIVENAVRHGMKSSGDPIHISIVTRETNGGAEIVVEDDGAGYKPSADSRQHTALSNISQRLNMMCGGSLTIAPRESGGTVVKITIPADKPADW